MKLKNIIPNPGLRFIIKFLVLFLGLNYFNDFFIGITAPGGLYVPYLEQHLNYVAWIRHSILWGSMHVSGLFGYESYVDGPYHLRSVTGPGVQMVYSCIGLGIMSFWTAFVVAHEINWKKKVFWTFIGLLTIWIINCFRVSVILAAAVNRWNASKYLDHHDTFNIVAYIFIFLLIILFLRKEGLHKKETTIQAEPTPQI
jgi:exosortase/archaeosortase family protein